MTIDPTPILTRQDLLDAGCRVSGQASALYVQLADCHTLPPLVVAQLMCQLSDAEANLRRMALLLRDARS